MKYETLKDSLHLVASNHQQVYKRQMATVVEQRSGQQIAHHVQPWGMVQTDTMRSGPS